MSSWEPIDAGDLGWTGGGTERQARADFRPTRSTSHRPPGRPRGPTPITREARALFKDILDRLAPRAEEWILQTAREGDPAKATELLLKLAAYFIPAVARTELVGADGGNLVVRVVSLAPELPQHASNAVVEVPSRPN